MQTIKTIVVVALLLTVCYGAYKAMNTEVDMPADLNEWAAQTGNDTLPDFSIPPITANDNVGQTSTLPSGSDNSVPAFPMPELGSNSLSPAASTTPFANNAAPLLDGNPLTNSLAPSNVPNSLNPPIPDFPMPSAVPSLNAGGGINGPSVAFNPNSSAPDLPKLPGETPKLSNDLPANNLAANNLAANNLAASNLPNNSFGDPAQSLIDAGSNGPSVPLLDVGSDSKSFVSTPSGDSGRNSIPSTDSKLNPPTKPFATARTEALQMATQSGKLQEALETLSAYYDSPELGYEEHTDLVDILDALSREVVYSDRHLLLPPYTVSAQDNLQSLATKHKLNPEFLAAVNKMGSSSTVIPNTSLKVLDGPFRAQISLNKGELTLFLRKSYAGRFPVSISQKNRPAVGTYEVIDRRTDRAYYGANAPIPAGNPINPYGGFWIGLGGAGDYAIHGTPEQESTELKDAGCISLSPIDAADVYRILTKGSVVEIRQ